MKRCSLFCVGWWPFLLLPLLLLFLVLLFQWRSIERDVAGYAGLALDDNRMSWASVSTHNRGRDVLISGTAPSEEAVQQALQLARQAKGVNRADFDGTIAAPAPVQQAAVAPEKTAEPPVSQATPTPEPVELSAPELAISFQDGKVVLQGAVADQTETDTLVNDAAAVYGADNVINQLTIAENTDDLPFLFGLFNVAKNLDDGDQIAVSGDKLTLTGDVGGLGIKKRIGSQLALFFSGEVDNQLNIALPRVDAAQLVDSGQCQQLFNDRLSTTKVHFATGSADVVPESYELLDEIVTLASRCPEAVFEISGHTDSNGNLEFNRQLSERRAQAVADHIIGSGLPAERFQVVGYGPDKPVADNTTASGRSANRRIEFTLKN